MGDTADAATSLTWTHLSCPPGEFVVGVNERQGGWTAEIQLLCAKPNANGGWTQDVAGGEAGGPHGDHSAQLLCPRNTWMTGVSGQMVTAYYYEVTHEQAERYLGNPMLYCGNAANPAQSTVVDPNFKPQKPSGGSPTQYQDSPAVFCSAGAYVDGANVSVGHFHNPDIKAVQPSCAAPPRPPPVNLPPGVLTTPAPIRR